MRPTKAYCVRRRVHAIDEMLIYANSAKEAEEKARLGEWEDIERVPDTERASGFESIRRWRDEDREP